MGFRDVFGHDSAARALQNALASSSLAGAYLFTGPQGIGKTTLAKAFGQAAACLSPAADPFDACGICDSCIRAQSGGHPEIAVISPAGDQTQIWQFWDRDGRPPGILQRTLRYAPTIGRRRVYIIERADTLNEAAANSLLKALEEPPPYVLFVLLSPHAARLLPTILSRCQMVRMSASPQVELEQYLADIGIQRERAAAYAAYSEGRAGAALSLARGKGIEPEIDAALDLADSLATAEPLAAMKLGERIRKQAAGIKALASADSVDSVPASGGASDESESSPREKVGRKSLGIVLDLLTAYYRDLLASRLAGSEAKLLHVDRAEQIAASASRREARTWAACIDYLLTARRRVEQNANPRLVTDALAVQLINAR